MHIRGSRNLQATYTMASATLQTTNDEKDLGIWIDSSLKPSIDVSPATQMLGLIFAGWPLRDPVTAPRSSRHRPKIDPSSLPVPVPV